MKNEELYPNGLGQKELPEEKLETVAGGSYRVSSNFHQQDIGKWYSLGRDSEYIYRVRKAYNDVVLEGVVGFPAALLDRFRFDGSAAWYCGTVTEDKNASYCEIIPPAIVHDDKMYPST